MIETDPDDSVLDYGINEAEVNHAIKEETVKEIDLTGLPIEVDVKDIDSKDSEDFAIERRNGFGGSDSSILCGVNPFKTLRELIIQKASPELSQEEKEVGKLAAVRKGNDLEPLIMQKSQALLKFPIIKPPDMYKFKDFPYLKMNFDGVAEPTEEGRKNLPELKGKYFPDEIKVVTAKGQKHYNPFVAIYSEVPNGKFNPTWKELPPNISKEDWTIEKKAAYYGVPPYYYTQLQQEMMALDAPFGMLSAMFDTDWSLTVFFVWRDEAVQRKIIIEGAKAWQKVEDLKRYPEFINKI